MPAYATTIKTKDAHRDFERRLMCGKTGFEIMEDKSEPCNRCAKLNKCLRQYASPNPGYRKERKVEDDNRTVL